LKIEFHAFPLDHARLHQSGLIHVFSEPSCHNIRVAIRYVLIQRWLFGGARASFEAIQQGHNQ
jgi:hypothetical protein